MEYRLTNSLSNDKYTQLLARGWRRFGRTVFRPKCTTCQECDGIRVRVSEFHASKSQRRCRNRNSDIDVTVHRPSISRQHIELYNRYHADMSERRAWPETLIDPDQPNHYITAFLDGGFEFACEFQYRLQGQLIAVGLVDITSSAMSSVYFFHEPELRHRALGTFSILTEIDYAARQNVDWFYLGYYIADCGSMNYKNRFVPHELLTTFCSDRGTPKWQSPADNSVPQTR